jgi:hypothetical protein
MKTTNIFKAQRTVLYGDPVSSHAINIEQPMPDFDSMDEARAVYAKEGKEIADALFSSLPGGTLDALLIEMLDRKRSLLVVSQKGICFKY